MKSCVLGFFTLASCIPWRKDWLIGSSRSMNQRSEDKKFDDEGLDEKSVTLWFQHSQYQHFSYLLQLSFTTGQVVCPLELLHVARHILLTLDTEKYMIHAKRYAKAVFSQHDLHSQIPESYCM